MEKQNDPRRHPRSPSGHPAHSSGSPTAGPWWTPSWPSRYGVSGRGDRPTFPVPVPFGLRSAWHLHQDRLYVAPGDAFRVDVHDADGTLLRAYRTDPGRAGLCPRSRPGGGKGDRQTHPGAPGDPRRRSSSPPIGNGIRGGPPTATSGWSTLPLPETASGSGGCSIPDGIFLGECGGAAELPGDAGWGGGRCWGCGWERWTCPASGSMRWGRMRSSDPVTRGELALILDRASALELDRR